jgi:hypothetical protein
MPQTPATTGGSHLLGAHPAHSLLHAITLWHSRSVAVTLTQICCHRQTVADHAQGEQHGCYNIQAGVTSTPLQLPRFIPADVTMLLDRLSSKQVRVGRIYHNKSPVSLG